MFVKIAALLLCVSTVLAMVGCGSDSTPASSEQKKAFMGGPMPKGFVSGPSGSAPGGSTAAGPPPGAEDAAAKAMAAEKAKHQ